MAASRSAIWNESDCLSRKGVIGHVRLPIRPTLMSQVISLPYSARIVSAQLFQPSC